MTVNDKLKQAAAMKAFEYILKDPDKNLPKMMDSIAKLDDSDSIVKQVETIKSVFLDPSSNWRQLILNLLRDVDPEEIRHIFKGFAVNDALIGGRYRKEYMPAWAARAEDIHR